MLAKNNFGCPYLFLAPMEGVGDRSFRRAISVIGGFDEACTEFLRVPANAHIASLSTQYDPNDTAPIPQAVQIMGSDPALMAAMSAALEARGAPRIDLNCGCPSGTVTGKGAGSSLLKSPELLHDIARAMVQAVDIPVTAKLRSGFSDTSLFKENLLAAQESGISFLTLHPRTKDDGYGPPARWELIAEAKALLRIPVVGNGDIVGVAEALKVLEISACDALMIGRGALKNPWVFHEIKAHFARTHFVKEELSFESYLRTFVSSWPAEMSLRNRINKLKQLMGYFLQGNENLYARRASVLRASYESVDEFLNQIFSMVRENV